MNKIKNIGLAIIIATSTTLAIYMAHHFLPTIIANVVLFLSLVIIVSIIWLRHSKPDEVFSNQGRYSEGDNEYVDGVRVGLVDS